MMFFKRFFGAVAGVVCVTSAFGAMFSDYGQIQNVQNYSSNPYWNPNGPYNQRTMPTPVYAQGADLNAGDCTRTVSALVASYCATRNGCMTESLDDARPALMVQLSQLPGHNYVGSCAGFIDSEFAKYKGARGNAGVYGGAVVAFPDAPGAANVNAAGGVQIANPFAQKTPDWVSDMNERSAELVALQAQNGLGSERLVATPFPKTVDDLSFAERIENERQGMAAYADKSAYDKIDIQSDEEYMAPIIQARKDALLRAQKLEDENRAREHQLELAKLTGSTATPTDPAVAARTNNAKPVIKPSIIVVTDEQKQQMMDGLVKALQGAKKK